MSTSVETLAAKQAITEVLHGYLDRLSARDGQWRIGERRYENDLTQVIPVTPAAETSAGA